MARIIGVARSISSNVLRSIVKLRKGDKETKQLAYGVLQERRRQQRSTNRTRRKGHELRTIGQRMSFSQRNNRAYRIGKRRYAAAS